MNGNILGCWNWAVEIKWTCEKHMWSRDLSLRYIKENASVVIIITMIVVIIHYHYNCCYYYDYYYYYYFTKRVPEPAVILKSLSGSGAFACTAWRSDISAAVFFAKECYWILSVRTRLEVWRVQGGHAGTAGSGFVVLLWVFVADVTDVGGAAAAPPPVLGGKKLS